MTTAPINMQYHEEFSIVIIPQYITISTVTNKQANVYLAQ